MMISHVCRGEKPPLRSRLPRFLWHQPPCRGHQVRRPDTVAGWYRKRHVEGGLPGSGGTSGLGGATATGGTSSPGACQESVCGSHKWACWKVPTPPSEKLPNPMSYTDLNNGAVRDNVTCLVWEKANPSTQGTWQASVDRGGGLASSRYAGFGDWRMPTRMEMASLVDPS